MHLVQHPPSTPSTHSCLYSLHSHDYELTPECSIKSQCAFLQFDCHKPALHGSSMVKSSCHILTGASYCNSLMNRVLLPGAPPIDHLQVIVQSRSFMASKCISKHSCHSFWLWLQVHATMASKCISNVARLWPPSASLSSLDLGLSVHLHTGSIEASREISKLTQLRLPSASLSSRCHGLQVYIWTHSHMASKFGQTLPSSASPNPLDQGLGVHLYVHSSTAFKCICELARLLSPSLHDHGLQVHLHTRLITASKCISEFTWLASSAAPRISFKHHLRLFQIYHV